MSDSFIFGAFMPFKKWVGAMHAVRRHKFIISRHLIRAARVVVEVFPVPKLGLIRCFGFRIQWFVARHGGGHQSFRGNRLPSARPHFAGVGVKASLWKVARLKEHLSLCVGLHSVSNG